MPDSRLKGWQAEASPVSGFDMCKKHAHEVCAKHLALFAHHKPQQLWQRETFLEAGLMQMSGLGSSSCN